LALDACYSGTADAGIALRGDPGKRPGANPAAERDRYIDATLQYKSRLMFTSGGKVRTPDQSAFVAKFLEALRSGGDGILNAPELTGYLSTALPKPVASTFGDHEPGGDFLFIGKHIPTNAGKLPIQPAEAASNTGSAKGNLKDEIEKDMAWIEGGVYRYGIMGPLPKPTTTTSGVQTKVDSSFLVELSGFYLSKFEVTQGLWRKVMGGDPSELKFKGCDRCPVDNISWDDAQLFIRTLNAKTGQTYRLPTEFEWEYAARCGNINPECVCAEELDLKDLGWYKSNSGERTHPVGEKQPNRLGLYDMAGNLKEWTSTRMFESFYKA
jgi:formylglycine-generating enzyme required for sulfatase activity